MYDIFQFQFFFFPTRYGGAAIRAASILVLCLARRHADTKRTRARTDCANTRAHLVRVSRAKERTRSGGAESHARARYARETGP